MLVEIISKQTLDIDQVVQIKYLNASAKIRKMATPTKKEEEKRI